MKGGEKIAMTKTENEKEGKKLLHEKQGED